MNVLVDERLSLSVCSAMAKDSHAYVIYVQTGKDTHECLQKRMFAENVSEGKSHPVYYYACPDDTPQIPNNPPIPQKQNRKNWIQVGVLTMAGKGPELLVSPTDDMGKILSSLHGVSVHGKTNFAAAIQIAQLALKHRRNKHGGQRIIIFVSSPIEDEVRFASVGRFGVSVECWVICRVWREFMGRSGWCWDFHSERRCGGFFGVRG